jgi:hypothetical protein
MKAEECIGTIELERKDGDYDIWEIVKIGGRLYYGSSCNACFLRHGYVEIDSDYYNEREATHAALEELYDELVHLATM